MQQRGRRHQAGDFPLPVTIQQASESSRTATGAIARSWSTFAQRWARYQTDQSIEVYRARQVFPEARGVFEMAGYAAVTPKMRILYDSRYFDILGVQTLDGQSPANAETLFVVVKEGISQGS